MRAVTSYKNVVLEGLCSGCLLEGDLSSWSLIEKPRTTHWGWGAAVGPPHFRGGGRLSPAQGGMGRGSGVRDAPPWTVPLPLCTPKASVFPVLKWKCHHSDDVLGRTPGETPVLTPSGCQPTAHGDEPKGGHRQTNAPVTTSGLLEQPCRWPVTAPLTALSARGSLPCPTGGTDRKLSDLQRRCSHVPLCPPSLHRWSASPPLPVPT